MNKLIRNSDKIIGIIILIYGILVNLVSGRKIAFSEIFIIAGFILIIFNVVKKKLEKESICKKLIKVAKVLIVIGLAVFILIEAAIIAYPKHSKENADYLIVLGAGLKGNNLSKVLKERLDSAIDLVNKYDYSGKIVVSGGKGSDEYRAEADAMKEYLIKKGINKKNILVEDKSTSTAENLIFSKKIIEKDSGKSVKKLNIKIVTTDFHCLRSRILAYKKGYGNIELYSSSSIKYLIPVFYTREAFALVEAVVFE